MRVVLDVNVLLSAVIAPLGILRRIVESQASGRYRSVTSPGIIGELRVKLSLPRISRRYNNPASIAAWLFTLLESDADLIAVSLGDVREITGDAEDDYVLSTVRMGQADILVTGDHGLLDLREYAAARIISPRTFSDELHV